MKITITQEELLEIITTGLKYRTVKGIRIDDCKVTSFDYINNGWNNEVQLTIIPDDKW